MRYLFTVFALCIYMISWAQVPLSKEVLSDKERSLYKKALKLSSQEDYTQSDKILNKLLNKHKDFADALILKAGNAYNQKDYDESVKIFKEVISRFPEYNTKVYFSLATAQKADKDFDGAARSYKLFIEKTNDQKLKEKAQDLLTRTAFAAKAIKNPVPYNRVKLDAKINTSGHEYIPSISIDGSQLIFTRRTAGQEDLYIATLKGDKVTSVEPFTDMNTMGSEGVHTISGDDKMIIYTACDRKKEQGCDLYFSKWANGSWSPEQNLGHRVNSPAWDAQPSLSADGKILFFSSSRKGSRGKDIWISVKDDRFGWTDPQPLPDGVNTIGDEESPFFHPDNQTLYFRSNGHLGMGGFDVFYTRYNTALKKWSKPKNLGYPINTEGDEGALTISLDGKTAYFASDQGYDHGQKKNLDLFKFELYPEARPKSATYVKIKVIDSATKIPIDCEFTTREVQSKTDLQVGQTKDGVILTALPANVEYALIIEKEGYVYHSENFNLKGIHSAIDPFELVVELSKISVPSFEEHTYETEIVKSEPVIMKNIFFDTGSADLRAESDFEIEKLFNLMQEQPEIRIQIIGHTDNTGSQVMNNQLSLNRAMSIKNRLITMGLSSKRISTVGKGSLDPIADNETVEGRQLNRRTEFIILY